MFIAAQNLRLFNPDIVKKSEPYEAEEDCLSLTAPCKAKRWKFIKVRYENGDFQTHFKTFPGWTAQIIQHEVNHWAKLKERLNG